MITFSKRFILNTLPALFLGLAFTQTPLAATPYDDLLSLDHLLESRASDPLAINQVAHVKWDQLPQIFQDTIIDSLQAYFASIGTNIPSYSGLDPETTYRQKRSWFDSYLNDDPNLFSSYPFYQAVRNTAWLFPAYCLQQAKELSANRRYEEAGHALERAVTPPTLSIVTTYDPSLLDDSFFYTCLRVKNCAKDLHLSSQLTPLTSSPRSTWVDPLHAYRLTHPRGMLDAALTLAQEGHREKNTSKIVQACRSMVSDDTLPIFSNYTISREAAGARLLEIIRLLPYTAYGGLMAETNEAYRALSATNTTPSLDNKISFEIIVRMIFIDQTGRDANAREAFKEGLARAFP